MGQRTELAPRSYDDFERAEAERLELTLSSTAGRTVEIMLHQDPAAGISGVLYDCALLLAARLVEEPGLVQQTGKVVEIGCGTGCAGLVAASLGADVVCTDKSERALCLVEKSANESKLRSVSCLAWDWRDPVPPGCKGASTILASDVVYTEDTSLLLAALDALASEGTVVLLMLRVRSAASLAGLRSLLAGARERFKECAPVALSPAAKVVLRNGGKEVAVHDHHEATYFYRLVR
eukprot:gb/GFBE01042575.1/.p1 GENE.gb/GFBE01042575.1/~~gb/GFBE01042575.1/.p1  ORF type:complete len:236 (+),score=40.28 gb/GFBE01042575.1/:1-708(+)